MTLSTRYDFPLETEHDQEIETFFEQVFPDTNVRHFMKKFLASCLAGWNEYEILCFWTGANEGKQTGGNGKSALCTLMAKALGICIPNKYRTYGTFHKKYSKQEDIVPSWNLVTCCNIMPEFSSTDGGVKRRVRIIPFESKFVDDVDNKQWKDLKHVFPCDH